MDCSRLRHRLALQSVAKARTARGGNTDTWSTEATVWGAVEPLNGRELFQAQQVDSQVTVRIRLRRYSGLVPEWRIQWTDRDSATRTYNILSIIDPDERGAEHVLLCKEATD